MTRYANHPLMGNTPWPTGSQPADQADTERAPRQQVIYRCAEGHATTLVFAAEAEPPGSWDCRTCGGPAALGGAAPGAGAGARLPGYRKPGEASAERKNLITHWDQLAGRRSEAELEQALAERLAEIGRQRGTWGLWRTESGAAS